MTVSTTTSRSGPYAGAGTTGPFTVNFRFLDAAHLEVIRTDGTGEHVLVLSTDYTVAGVGNPTGSVTLLVALPTGETLTIIRNVPVTQEADYVQNDDFPAQSHEDVLDKLTMIAQQHEENIGRSLTLPASSSSGVSTKLPVPEANKLIGWNAAADGLQNMDGSTIATIVAFGTARADVFSGTGAQTAFTLTNSPGAQANLDVAIGGVTQRPGIDYTWSSGTTLTFTTAPPLGSNNVLVRYLQALPQGVSDSAASQFVQAGTGATLRTAQNKMRERISLKDFGAVGDGVTDDTTAVRNAFVAVQAASGTLYIPTGRYLLSGAGTELVLVNGGTPFSIVGDGAANSVFLIAGSVPATTDMFRILPGTGQAMSGMLWRDFSILPKTGSPGRDGIVFDLMTAAPADIFSRIRIEGVLIYGGAGVALRVANTDIKTESWYNNEIRDCIFHGGAYLNRIGDHNEFHGTNFNGGAPALFLNMVSIPGGTHTAHATFRNCSYTSSAGAITIADGFFVSFEQCAVEQCTPNASGSIIKVAGVSNPAHNITFEGLSLAYGVVDATKMLDLNNMVTLKIRDSIISTLGTGACVHFGATAAPEYAAIETTALYTTGANRVFVTAGTLGAMSDELGTYSKFRTSDFQQLCATAVGKVYTQNVNAAGDVEYGTSSGSFKYAQPGKSATLVIFNLITSHAAVYSADNVILNGNQIIGNRDTGWTPMTGTIDETTALATGTVTLLQLAQRVHALQTALTTHGLIGV